MSSWLWPAYRQSSQLVTSPPGTSAAARAASSWRAASSPSRASGSRHDRTTSRCSGEHTSPTAENTPARGGTTTARMPNRSAIAARVEWPRTTERDQGEITGIDALFDRHHSHGTFHRRVDDRDHARRP